MEAYAKEHANMKRRKAQEDVDIDLRMYDYDF